MQADYVICREKKQAYHCCRHSESFAFTVLWIFADKILGSPTPVYVTSHHSNILGGALLLTSTRFLHLQTQPIRSHSLGHLSRPISFHCADFHRVISDAAALQIDMDSGAVISYSLSLKITATNDSYPHYEELLGPLFVRTVLRGKHAK